MVLTIDEAMDYVHRMESNFPKNLTNQEYMAFYQGALNRARRSSLDGMSIRQVTEYFLEKIKSLEERAGD